MIFVSSQKNFNLLKTILFITKYSLLGTNHSLLIIFPYPTFTI